MQDKLIAIVPAAGVGARAQESSSQPVNGPKQYRLLRNESMLRHAVRALLADSRIDRVLVAVSAADVWAESALAGLPRTEVRACGGPSRAETVMAALRQAQPGAHDWALVHDAARPGLPSSALTRLIDTCLEQGVGGLLALPVADTVKRGVALDHNACILTGGAAQAGHAAKETINRDNLWVAQTPQMFPALELLHALEHALEAGKTITDEASAMEQTGYKPRLVPGSVRNFKVTWPEDFELMEKWL
ncbi:MAG TPA: 2-C-methyl-D-erythritol 4-phosphate cytidylyltransferase [Pusillimonas sp.]|uniref:IspD/TarI family cytidylyltransferase n=1 Tax=Pusillimonas sp. TaxID=3040095 RepID=UPI002BC4C38B|nr:2-C-methyl-D-erythritol 4-phosphate cytidylyltransferase [Pusillimonas sp.]HUH87662.1 2-C-methyl-D-erythritol 4-phosphate cytidylyltransferase [Pusillimonas sp.]